MNTKEDREAAAHLLLSAKLGEVTQELVCAGQLLAREVAVERSERQRRIEQAAEEIAKTCAYTAGDTIAFVRGIITRHLDGESNA